MSASDPIKHYLQQTKRFQGIRDPQACKPTINSEQETQILKQAEEIYLERREEVGERENVWIEGCVLKAAEEILDS